MTDAYDYDARAAAAEMLAPKAQGGMGQVVQLTYFGLAVRDPDTGITTRPTTGKTGSGVESAFTFRDVDGTQIKAGDKQFLLSPFDDKGVPLPDPAVGTQINLEDGSKWRVEAVAPLSPTAVRIMFTLQLRGS